MKGNSENDFTYAINKEYVQILGTLVAVKKSPVREKLCNSFINYYVGYVNRPVTNSVNALDNTAYLMQDEFWHPQKQVIGLPPSSIVVVAGRHSVATDLQSLQCNCFAGLREPSVPCLRERIMLPYGKQDGASSGP